MIYLIQRQVSAIFCAALAAYAASKACNLLNNQKHQALYMPYITYKIIISFTFARSTDDIEEQKNN